MNDVFVWRFLKLRIALLALQKNDQLVQRMRFHCVESQLMKRNFENENENNLNVDTQSQSEDDATAQRICRNWRLNDDFLCFKNVWYVFVNLMQRLLFKQNHDDFYANHFNVKKRILIFWHHFDYLDIILRLSWHHSSIRLTSVNRIK